MTVGLVTDFPTESDASKEADRLGLRCQINKDVPTGRVTLKQLAEHYLEADFGVDAVREKSDTTKYVVTHYVRDWIIPKWGSSFADEIRALEVQRWLKSQVDKGFAWTTAAKVRGIFSRMYKVGVLHELVEKNPIENVETRQTTNYKAIMLSPDQTLRIMRGMIHPLHRALVLTCAATALRASELLALRWSDLLWEEDRIRISKRWALGAEGKPKTEASDGYVPMHPILAGYLREWRSESQYSTDTDFVFPSPRKDGKVPIDKVMFVRDYLRPTAKAIGVQIADGHRFGLHNLRHSLSNWLVNVDKSNPKTVQGLLRHSKIETTLNLYTQPDRDETEAAQGPLLGGPETDGADSMTSKSV